MGDEDQGQNNEIIQTEGEEAEEEEDEEETEEMEEEETETVVPREHLLYGQLPELCLLPEQRGTCFGQLLRYRFDPSSGDCVGFFFSGCAPNANNFASYESCARACGPWKAERVCEQAVDDGREKCQGGTNGHGQQGVSVPKWYFDPALGNCALFFWSGCGGNGNRFQSKSECENLCRREILAQTRRHADPCGLPMDAGPCGDLVAMWYFDAGAQQCRRFTFGGCRGNANRFVSRADCVSQCPPSASASLAPSGPSASSSAFLPRLSLSSAADILRPRLFAFPVGTLLSGASTLTLKCVAEQRERREGGRAEAEEDNFSWYKDGQEMKGLWDGGRMRLFQSVLSSSPVAVGELHISNATLADAGQYSCAFGPPSSLFSAPISVHIAPAPNSVSSCTGDNGPPSVCQTVLRTGLCATLRYGRYCCRTCTGSDGA